MSRLFNNGSNQYLELTTAAANLKFDRSNAFSVSCWIYHVGTTAGVGDTVIGNLNTASNFQGWELGRDDSSHTSSYQFFLINSFPSNAIQVASNFAPSLNTWYQVVLTYDGSSSANGVIFYVNGASQTNTNTINALSATTVSTTKVRVSIRTDNSQPMKARVADAAIWNVALSANEAKGLASGARPYLIRPNSIQLYLPIDGISSPEPDISGNSNNGVLTGTPVAANGPPFTLWTPMVPSPSPAVVPAAPFIWGFQPWDGASDLIGIQAVTAVEI